MRLTKLIRNKPDKYLEHFFKYNRINHIIQIENENYFKEKNEEPKSKLKDISKNKKEKEKEKQKQNP